MFRSEVGFAPIPTARENPKSKRNPSWSHHTQQVVLEEILVLLLGCWVVHSRTICCSRVKGCCNRIRVESEAVQPLQASIR